jgi:hypothetical protein
MMKLHLALFSYAGVVEQTVDALLGEIACTSGIELSYDRTSGDALISRSRSIALSRFFEANESDVCFMLDRDIVWNPGDLVATAQKAIETGACIAGLYAQRDVQSGVASRLVAKGYRPGEDRLWPSERLAAGFTAIPREIVDALLKRKELETDPQLQIFRCVQDPGPPVRRFWDFFRPMVVPSEIVPGENEYLSEDWSFSARVHAAGRQTFIWSKPILGHVGSFEFRLEEAQVPRKETASGLSV